MRGGNRSGLAWLSPAFALKVTRVQGDGNVEQRPTLRVSLGMTCDAEPAKVSVQDPVGFKRSLGVGTAHQPAANRTQLRCTHPEGHGPV